MAFFDKKSISSSTIIQRTGNAARMVVVPTPSTGEPRKINPDNELHTFRDTLAIDRGVFQFPPCATRSVFVGLCAFSRLYLASLTSLLLCS